MQKKYRLKSSRFFNIVYRRGKSVSNKILVLMWLKGTSLKVGFTVSKKIGNSVTRNKVRRRLKEAFRDYIPNVANGYTYILLARSPIRYASYNEISKSIEDLLEKAKLYNYKGQTE